MPPPRAPAGDGRAGRRRDGGLGGRARRRGRGLVARPRPPARRPPRAGPAARAGGSGPAARRRRPPGRTSSRSGALEPRKAPALLAAAYRRAVAGGLDADLVVVGSGRLEGVLRDVRRASAWRAPSTTRSSTALYAGALALVHARAHGGLRPAAARGGPARRPHGGLGPAAAARDARRRRAARAARRRGRAGRRRSSGSARPGARATAWERPPAARAAALHVGARRAPDCIAVLRGGGPVSVTVVVVTHDSAADLAAAAGLDRRAPRPHARRSSSWTPARRDGSRRPGRGRGRRGRAPRRQPGLRRGQQRGRRARAATTSPSCSTPTSSCATTGSLRPGATQARGRDALLVPRLLNADGSVQRSAHPRPGTAAGARAGARAAPARCRARLRERARALRAATGPRPVGWAIAACARRAARRSCARLGPFDPGAFLFYEDLDLCLRAGRGRRADRAAPRASRVVHARRRTPPRRRSAASAFALQAQRRREVVGARLGAAGAGRSTTPRRR